MSAVIETRIKSLQRQIETIKSFLTEPRGVFETIDQVVKNIRYANRETLRVLQTGKLTGKLQGQVLEKGPIRNILKRIIDRIRERIGR